MAENKKVTLAWPLEHNGTQHKAGSTVSLPTDLAVELVRGGRARTPDAAPASSTSEPAASVAAAPAAKGK